MEHELFNLNQCVLSGYDVRNRVKGNFTMDVGSWRLKNVNIRHQHMSLKYKYKVSSCSFRDTHLLLVRFIPRCYFQSDMLSLSTLAHIVQPLIS